MRIFSLLLFSFLFTNFCAAQEMTYKAFTVNDGLPSNYVYACVEDNRGFLWVATDAGIARFDGKNFQVFTTQDGLPDNEVLRIVKENNGRIWVNCFKQRPAYFDDAKNRFINAKEDSNLAKIDEGTANMFISSLKSGGMLFYNELGSYILKDKKITSHKNRDNLKILFMENKDSTFIMWARFSPDSFQKYSQTKLYQLKGSKNIDSAVLLKNLSSGISSVAIENNSLYDFHLLKNKLFIFSDIQTNPLRYKVDSLRVPESILDYTITNTLINFYTNSGKIYVYDKKSLQIKFIFNENFAHNALYNDGKGNIWVGTIDKGLLLYKKNRIDYVRIPKNFNHPNFISVLRKPDGTLLAGNYYGEILEKKGSIYKIHSFTNNKNAVFRQREILLSQNKIFTFSDEGIFENYSKEITKLNKTVYAKTACIYNDSTIIIGQVGIILQLNTRTGKLYDLYRPNKRITAICRGIDGSIYYGSTDGLYKYNFLKGSDQPVLPSNFLLSDRITAICTSSDSVLWVATAGNGLVGIKDNRVLFHFTEKEGLINNTIQCLTLGESGQLWVGTTGGLSAIKFQLHKDSIHYTIQNLTVNDGLTSNIVNDLFYDKDTIYAATGEGISIIPTNISIPKFNIPVQLIRVSINQRDTIITKIYNLNYKQQDIQVQLAGIELGGHLKNIQYTLDGKKDWITINGNILTLRLNSGNRLLQFRAIDVNGNISNQILSVQFNIATPFWKQWWFWVLLLLLLQLFVFHTIFRKQKKKREAKLAKEIASVQTAALEQQAFTSLMNPHFMFNALNSIQHYINTQDRKNANRYLSDFASLIRKNFEAAQQSFISLEQEIENIKLYFRLEQMRFSNRFSYEINISQEIDIEDWMIPNMMLQPFLENALLHGIMPSNIDGKIMIDFQLQKEDLIIIITDNGIGVANSRSLKTNNGHKSRGMELIEKRISALSFFGKKPITLHSFPANDDPENPGNKIILFIPVGLFPAWLKAQRK